VAISEVVFSTVEARALTLAAKREANSSSGGGQSLDVFELEFLLYEAKLIISLARLIFLFPPDRVGEEEAPEFEGVGARKMGREIDGGATAE